MWNSVAKREIRKVTSCEREALERFGGARVALGGFYVHAPPEWTQARQSERWKATDPAGFADFERVLREAEEPVRRAQQSREQRMRDGIFGAFARLMAAEHFAALGLETNATEAGVTRAFRARAIKAHPDRGGSHEAFVALNTHYQQALRFARGEPTVQIATGAPA